jgi:hypothetical protein
VAEAIRWQIAEGELIQIIGRSRGVNRTVADPVEILVLADMPLPLPINQTLSSVDLDPSPVDLMMAAGAVAFENPTDAASAYPFLWRTRGAAKMAFARFAKPRLGTFPYKYSLIRECTQPPAEVSYQRSGAGRSPSVAQVDLNLIKDPAATLTEKLGKLASCRMSSPQQAMTKPSKAVPVLIKAGDDLPSLEAGPPNGIFRIGPRGSAPKGTVVTWGMTPNPPPKPPDPPARAPIPKPVEQLDILPVKAFVFVREQVQAAIGSVMKLAA